jgi:hypothetical protein
MNKIIDIITFHEKKTGGVVKCHSSHSGSVDGNDKHDHLMPHSHRHLKAPFETEYIIKHEESEQLSYELQQVGRKDRQLRSLEDELAFIEHRFDDVQWVDEDEQTCHEDEELYKGIEYFNDDLSNPAKKVDQESCQDNSSLGHLGADEEKNLKLGQSPPSSCNVRRCSSTESLFSYIYGDMILDFENHEEDIENGLLVDFPTQRSPAFCA